MSSSASLAENVLHQWQGMVLDVCEGKKNNVLGIEFDLEGKRSELDSQASTITELREEGLAARKKLAQTTRGLLFSDRLSVF